MFFFFRNYKISQKILQLSAVQALLVMTVSISNSVYIDIFSATMQFEIIHADIVPLYLQLFPMVITK